MPLVDDFITRYAREFDFYQTAARICAEQCQAVLGESGIRAMVTHRAKQPDRLQEKIEKRSRDRSYDSVEAIYADIVDLAGVRISLFFPGDRREVGRLIEQQFTLDGGAKEFPAESQLPYKKRFTGYAATHYHVHLRPKYIARSQERYAQARVEIQVASLLMHAWAEVEHDLVYKPVSDELSVDEYAILDELNGLALSGEIALDRLQRALKQRVSRRGQSFHNHYELAAYLYSTIQPSTIQPSTIQPSTIQPSTIQPGGHSRNEPMLGRVDVLFRFLGLAGRCRPEHLEPLFPHLVPEAEGRPVAEQIADLILSEKESLYHAYERARREAGARNPYSSSEDTRYFRSYAQALFLDRWIQFEKGLRTLLLGRMEKAEADALPTGFLISWWKSLQELKVLDEETRFRIDAVRRLRNQLVHGMDVPDDSVLTSAADFLQYVVKGIAAGRVTGSAGMKADASPAREAAPTREPASTREPAQTREAAPAQPEATPGQAQAAPRKKRSRSRQKQASKPPTGPVLKAESPPPPPEPKAIEAPPVDTTPAQVGSDKEPRPAGRSRRRRKRKSSQTKPAEPTAGE